MVDDEIDVDEIQGPDRGCGQHELVPPGVISLGELPVTDGVFHGRCLFVKAIVLVGPTIIGHDLDQAKNFSREENDTLDVSFFSQLAPAGNDQGFFERAEETVGCGFFFGQAGGRKRKPGKEQKETKDEAELVFSRMTGRPHAIGPFLERHSTDETGCQKTDVIDSATVHASKTGKAVSALSEAVHRFKD